MFLFWDIFLIYFLTITLVRCNFYKSNLTDFQKCQIYYSRTGGVYKDFFPIVNPPNETDHNLQVDFHFSVLAASDAHILLSPAEDFKPDDPVYEIVVGAGGNTFCDIRRGQKSNVKESIRRTGLLSAVDVRSFWLHISREGLVEVGSEGSELAFMSWTDPEPLNLKVFSFSTWASVEAKWFFNCEREEHSKKIKRKMNDLDRLRQDLLNEYDPLARPVVNSSDLTTVNMSLVTTAIFLNEHRRTFVIRGECRMKWKDEKMVWNSSKYGDIKNLHIFRREIWQPDLILYNSVSSQKHILEDTMMVVTDKGVVDWKTTLNLEAWCNNNMSMALWPKDIHMCSIVLVFFKEFEQIEMQFNENDTFFGYQYNSEWSVLSLDVNHNKDFNMINPPILELVYTLQRRSEIYKQIFFTPFYIIAVSLLSSFWVSPFGSLKISLDCLALIMCSILLISLNMYIPVSSDEVPNLVMLYCFTLIASLVATLVSIIVVNISRNKQKNNLPRSLIRILTSSALKYGLCLYPPKNNISDEYDYLSDNSEGTHQELWILLGVTIDRIVFFVYLGLTIYALVIT